MNQAPHAALSHPLVAAYLADLDRALASADAQERLDTVTAVTEHLTDALGGDALGDNAEPSAERVRAVLDELGPVERIADAATPASASPASSQAPPSSQTPASAQTPAGDPDEKRPGTWIAPALLATAIVSLVLPLLGGALAIGCIVTAVVLLRGEKQRRTLLIATIAVSSVTLVMTAVLVLGTLAFTNFGGGTVTESSGPVVVSEVPAG